MKIRAVDMRCVVEEEAKVLYHRITKNGSSSLTASMELIIHGGVAATTLRERRWLRRQALNPSHLGVSSSLSVKEFFKFVVVRNPFDRTLSAYLSKVVGRYRKLPRGHPLRNIDPASEAEESPPSFGAFCNYLANGGLYDDLHWSPQVDFLVLPIEDYDYIARLETIDTDFQIIAQKLGGQNALGMLDEDPVHRTSATSRRSQFYDEDLYRLVGELYRKDFDAFGYDPMMSNAKNLNDAMAATWPSAPTSTET